VRNSRGRILGAGVAILMAGAMAPALAQPMATSWADVEGRIQYAY
jgi:hypothetical protein